jgi:hypothetical protein
VPTWCALHRDGHKFSEDGDLYCFDCGADDFVPQDAKGALHNALGRLPVTLGTLR